MPVPSKMADLSNTASSNSPAGSDAIGNNLDDYLRAGFAITKSTNSLSSSTIIAGSTVDLGTSDGEAVTVTGAATIASLGTVAAGLKREVTFASAGCILTNSAAIVLLGSSNLSPAAGDVVSFRSLGSGNWKQVSPTLSGAGLTSTMPLSGGTFTGSVLTAAAHQGLTVQNAASGVIGQSTAGLAGITIAGATSSDAAFIAYNHAASYASYMGLDTDNQWKVGGWSAGNVSYRLVHEGLSAVALPGTVAAGGKVSATQGLVIMSTATGGLGGLSISTTSSNASSAAYMEFNRAGAFASYFGIREDNAWAVGGWSMGAVSYRVVHEGLANPNLSGTVTAGNFTATSDRRLKSKIKKAIPRSLSESIQFVSFLWKSTKKSDRGVIAQQVREIAPEYVHEGTDGTLSVDKASLVLEAVLDLARRVKDLEGRA